MTGEDKGKGRATDDGRNPEKTDENTQHPNLCTIGTCAGKGIIFETDSDFLDHVQSHRNAKLRFCPKPYCAWTQVGYTSNISLSRHDNGHHPDGSVTDFKPYYLHRPYLCTVADCLAHYGTRSSFTTFKSAQQHRAQVHSQKLIRCPLCAPSLPSPKARHLAMDHLRNAHKMGLEAAREAIAHAEEKSTEDVDERLLEGDQESSDQTEAHPDHEEEASAAQSLEVADVPSSPSLLGGASSSTRRPTLPSLADLGLLELESAVEGPGLGRQSVVLPPISATQSTKVQGNLPESAQDGGHRTS